MGTFLKNPPDFSRHNEETRRVWAAFEAGKPVRVPVSITGSITNYIHNPDLNVRGYRFRDYFEDPHVQITAQLEYQDYKRHNWLCDQPMGLPEGGWEIFVDFQNCYDASWFGCELVYMDGYLPDTLPILAERKEKLYDLPESLPLEGGLIGRGITFREAMKAYCANHTYKDRPILPPKKYLGEKNDGVLDLAYKLRGAENILIDMYDDEYYYHDLMEYITRNLIRRMKALRERRWAEYPQPDVFKQKEKAYFSLADDAITMISNEAYMEFVYPYHKRIVDEFSDGSVVSMHLCGANMQHFGGLAKHLRVKGFDTGFPVDFGKLRDLVGPDVVINGGPTVMCIKAGPAAAIESEVRRILASGITYGGKFVMIAANNLAPQTPVEHIAAMYDAVKKYGGYNE